MITTLCFQTTVIAGKKMVRLENGLYIGDKASGFSLNTKGMDTLLSALKFFRNDSILIQFFTPIA